MTDGVHAFTLRAEHEGRNFGSVIAVGPNRASFNVGNALEAGGGVIATNHPAIIQALDDHPALKRTTAGDAPLAEVPDELGEMYVAVPETDRKRVDELTPEERQALEERLANASVRAEHASPSGDSIEAELDVGERVAQTPDLPGNLEHYTRDELVRLAAETYELDVDPDATKSQIIDALRSEVS